MRQTVPVVRVLSAQRVRQWIRLRGKSQEEVAASCLCTDRQVRNWLRRDTAVPVSRLYSLADCLECKPEDLLIAIPASRKKP